MMRSPVFLLIIIVSISTGANAKISAEEIIKKANVATLYAGKDFKANVRMTITDSQKRSRVREFSLLRKNVKGEDQNFYVFFKKPADVKKMVFMVKKHIEKDDERVLYLPALDLVKPIAASDKRTSFAGTDYFYEDVSGRNIYEDTYSLLAESDSEYSIKGVPKKAKSVEFTHFEAKIDKKSFLPISVRFYRGKLNHRSFEVLKTQKIDGILTIVESRMIDHERKSQTVSELSSVKYNLNLPDRLFTERSLRRVPRKYLK